MRSKRLLLACAVLALAFLCTSCHGITVADAMAERDRLAWAEPLLTAQIATEAEPQKSRDFRSLAAWRERVAAKLAAVGVK